MILLHFIMIHNKKKVLSFGTNQDYFLHDTSKTNLKVPFKIGYHHFPIV
jgi:hypothetical protein